MTRRVVILALAPRGAMAQYPAQLARALANYWEVIAFASRQAEAFYDIKQAGLKVIFEDRLLKLYSLTHLLRLHRKILEIGPDIIHDPVGTGYYWTVLLRFTLQSIPQVITLHDVLAHAGLSYLRRTAHPLVTKVAIRGVRAVCVHGRASKRYLLSLGCPANKVFIVPHGAYNLFGELRNPEFHDEPVVLFFGELRYNKGVDRLLNIAELVAQRVTNVRFVVAGSLTTVKQHSSEHSRALVAAVSRMQRSRHFEIIDSYIPEEKVGELFSYASVVVLPYREATQSGIVGIAYHFRRPVIATPVGDLPEIIEDGVTGFLRSSDEEIADAVVKLLLDQGLRQQMGNAGYKRAKRDLSWDSIACRLIEIYQSVLDNRSERSS